VFQERLKKPCDERREAQLLQKLLAVIEEKSRLSESCIGGEEVLQLRRVVLDDDTPLDQNTRGNFTRFLQFFSSSSFVVSS